MPGLLHAVLLAALSGTSGFGGGGGTTSTTGGSGGTTSTTGGSGGCPSATGGAGGAPATGGTGGSNPCEEAGNTIEAKYARCCIEVTGSGGGEPVDCTPALGAQSTCVAACTDEASCATLKGEDPDGAMAYADCLGGC